MRYKLRLRLAAIAASIVARSVRGGAERAAFTLPSPRWMTGRTSCDACCRLRVPSKPFRRRAETSFTSQMQVLAQQEDDTVTDTIGDGDDRDEVLAMMKEIKSEMKKKYHLSAWKNTNEAKMRERSTMNTALSIIPPDEAWDKIQRARHLARDDTMYQWPPAIRLFHPFVPRPYLASAATALAKVVEENEIDPFEITLDQLVILPDMALFEEEFHEQWEALDNDDKGDEAEVDDEVQQLIANEERIGKERLAKRMEKASKKNKISAMNGASETPGVSHTNNIVTDPAKKAPGGSDDGKKKEERRKPTAYPETQEEEEEQRQQSFEYNGPCIVFLEPNEASRAEMERLRKLLAEKLFSSYDAFSVSHSTPTSPETRWDKIIDDNKQDCFRPLLPIGRFPSVAAAVKLAKRLQRLWEPLTFPVTDFHLMSRDDKSANAAGGVVSHESRRPQSDLQFGCDAMVMLMGEEPTLDRGEADELIQYMYDDGGSNQMIDYDALFQAKEEEAKKDAREMMEKDSVLLGLLPEDEDDWNDGTTIVVGRTEFFVGAMRDYVGMPATSTIDGKDRVFGQGESGASRRRGSVSRQGNRWKSGDYGSKDGDL